jgi:hypothetical protein
MAVSQPKKKMDKGEIIEVLRRNAKMFKDEPEFVTYIVDLAMYLIENYLEQLPDGKPAEEKPFQATSKEVQNVYRVFQRFSTGKTPPRSCPFCGADTEGRRKCPNCDAMTF